MSEYLVRWKFGPNSLLNKLDRETWWYQQFHSNKKMAVDHYASLLLISSETMAMTVEIFEMIKMVPGQHEPKQLLALEEVNTLLPPNSVGGQRQRTTLEKQQEREKRDKKIWDLFEQGKTRAEIAKKMDLGYSTVCNIIREPDQ